MNKIAVIMAGGLGSRLWPRSTEKTPKQFIHLLGEGTMIQNTVARLQPLFSNEEIFIVAPEAMDKIIEDQLPAIPKENIILEPFAKNTAPCLALTDTIVGDRFSPDTVMVACPSDHVIYNVREFHQSLEVATQYAWEKKGIVTIGTQPTRPETSFGYIQVGMKEKTWANIMTMACATPRHLPKSPMLQQPGAS
jgi:mannose-1-phosphate guanylyltransferase